MSDYILIENDIAIFLPNFGEAIVTPRPGIMQASSKMTIQNQKVCLEGDEKNLLVISCPYFTTVFSVPGLGNITIKSLDDSHISKLIQVTNKAVLRQGGQFKANFQVITPAVNPASGSIDTILQYEGQGQFSTNNIKGKTK
jgi:hypothetical protein